MQEFDFIAIGDITTDEFIRLREDRAVITRDLSGREVLSMYFGDKLEFLEAINVPAVGNSPNAAVSAHRLGLRASLISDVGDDAGGNEILDWLSQEGLNTDFIEVQKGKTTNHHYVLQYGPERTILIKHETYAYGLPEHIGEPKWLYFSSVGEHGIAYHHEIAAFVKAHPNTKLTFQPGSFQIALGTEALADVYAATTAFFCNKEEAQQILKTEEKDITKLLAGIRALGPELPFITDGPRGSYLLFEHEAWHLPMYPDIAPPINRTGAGDAFASTISAYLALGMEPLEAWKRGPINSMAVTQFIGAQKGLLSREKLEAYLANAPVEYAPEQV